MLEGSGLVTTQERSKEPNQGPQQDWHVRRLLSASHSQSSGYKRTQ